MKKILLTLLCGMAAVVAAYAQSTAPKEGVKYPFAIYKKIHDPSIQNHMISVLVQGNVESIANEVKQMGGVIKYSNGNIACVRIPVTRIEELAKSPFVQRIDGSDAKLQVLNDQMILNNNIYLVQQGFGLPEALNGEGVCVGIIDEGIDFTHPDLRDAQNHSRIKWLWDQRLPINNNYTPVPYGYGQNFTNTQIDSHEADSVVDLGYSHGTHVTGIAAGNGNAVGNFHGVAPKADIVFVAVNEHQSDDNFLTSIVDAINYIFSKADSLHEPCAINISMGTYFGSHDGLDLQAQSIDYLVSSHNGRFISVAAGNEGAAPIHLHVDATPDSSFTWMGGNSNTNQLYFQLWGEAADLDNVEWMIAADDTAPNYDCRGTIPFQFITSQMGYGIQEIFNGGNRIGVVESYLDSSHGSYSLECLITPDSAYYYWRFMTRGTGKFDAWSFDYVPVPAPDSSAFPLIVKYKAPDLDQSICSSFQCSPKLITVGSYANRNYYTSLRGIEYDTMPENGGIRITPGSLSSFSSHGPTRDGRLKPEITATGEWLLSCAAQADLSFLTNNAPWFVAVGGLHKKGTGTSMASPVVAGTAALYLQKNPTASCQEVKDAILACTKTDAYTGSKGTLPNNYWGYGKLDAYTTIKGCSTVLVNEAGTPLNIYLENYPNPFADKTTVHYDLSYLTTVPSKASLSIHDALGRNVRDITLTGLAGEININKNTLGSGVYFYSLILDGKVVRTNKLVIL